MSKFFMQLRCIKYKNLVMKAHFKLLQITIKIVGNDDFSLSERLELIDRTQKLSKEFGRVCDYVKEICDKRIKNKNNITI